MSAFRVGDKVRRKSEFQGNWPHGDAVICVSRENEGFLEFPSTYGWWSANAFEPADTVEEYQLAKVTAELAEAKGLLVHASCFRFPNEWVAYRSVLGHWSAMAPCGTPIHKFDTQAEAIAKCREGK